MQQPIRILIADDHQVFRLGLMSVFRNEREFKVVGEATDGEQALKMIEDLHPDVLLLDLVMLYQPRNCREIFDQRANREAPPPQHIRQGGGVEPAGIGVIRDQPPPDPPTNRTLVRHLPHLRAILILRIQGHPYCRGFAFCTEIAGRIPPQQSQAMPGLSPSECPSSSPSTSLGYTSQGFSRRGGP